MGDVNNAEKNQETSDRIRELTAAESSLCKALATGKESAEIARKTAGVWYEIVKKYKKLQKIVHDIDDIYTSSISFAYEARAYGLLDNNSCRFLHECRSANRRVCDSIDKRIQIFKSRVKSQIAMYRMTVKGNTQNDELIRITKESKKLEEHHLPADFFSELIASLKSSYEEIYDVNKKLRQFSEEAEQDLINVNKSLAEEQENYDRLRAERDDYHRIYLKGRIPEIKKQLETLREELSEDELKLKELEK